MSPPRVSIEMMQLTNTTRIMKIAQNGCVSTRAAVRRTMLFGRNTHSALADENRNRSLSRLTTMNVYCQLVTKNKIITKISTFRAKKDC